MWLQGSPVVGERWVQGDERVTVRSIVGKTANVDIFDIPTGFDTSL